MDRPEEDVLIALQRCQSRMTVSTLFFLSESRNK